MHMNMLHLQRINNVSSISESLTSSVSTEQFEAAPTSNAAAEPMPAQHNDLDEQARGLTCTKRAVAEGTQTRVRKVDSTPAFSKILSIPSDAVGRVIGEKGARIKYLQGTPGLVTCKLDRAGLNTSTLCLAGSAAAVADAEREVRIVLSRATTALKNTSRRIHSWTLSPDGSLITPRNVHKTGRRPPHVHTTGVGKNFHAARKQGKRKEYEKERAMQLRSHAF